jgi:hypothetical protein
LSEWHLEIRGAFGEDALPSGKGLGKASLPGIASSQPLAEAGGAGDVTVGGGLEGLGLGEEGHLGLGAGDGRVDQLPVEEVLPAALPHDHDGMAILRPLGLVDARGEGRQVLGKTAGVQASGPVLEVDEAIDDYPDVPVGKPGAVAIVARHHEQGAGTGREEADIQGLGDGPGQRLGADRAADVGAKDAEVVDGGDSLGHPALPGVVAEGGVAGDGGAHDVSQLGLGRRDALDPGAAEDGAGHLHDLGGLLGAALLGEGDLDGGQGGGLAKVGEDGADLDGGELVGVADEDEGAIGGELLEEAAEEHEVDHGGLVDDEQPEGLEGLGLVEEGVDGLGLGEVAEGLGLAEGDEAVGDAPGGAAGGRDQTDVGRLHPAGLDGMPKEGGDGVGLAGAGAAGEDDKGMGA